MKKAEHLTVHLNALVATDDPNVFMWKGVGKVEVTERIREQASREYSNEVLLVVADHSTAQDLEPYYRVVKMLPA
jgi:hypothetical protein